MSSMAEDRADVRRASSAPPPNTASDAAIVSNGEKARSEKNEVSINKSAIESSDVSKSPRGSKHAFQPAGQSNNRSQKKRKAGNTPVANAVQVSSEDAN